MDKRTGKQKDEQLAARFGSGDGTKPLASRLRSRVRHSELAKRIGAESALADNLDPSAHFLKCLHSTLRPH